MLDQRERWWRIHTISFDALFFGRLRRYRFDDPERRFGVLYIAQRWSRALWEHPQQPDGIIYRSRHDPSKVCAALFDRCASVVVAEEMGRLVDPPAAAKIAEAIDWYGYSVDP